MSSKVGNERQIEQMCAFILQEAKEKAREIQIKTEHDFHLEKQRLVVAAKIALEEDFAVRKKKRETDKRIDESGAAQVNAFREMSSRDDVMIELKGEARTAIAKAVAGNPANYKKLLSTLITEAMVKMDEHEVVVCCRTADRAVVQSLLEDCTAAYKVQAVAQLEKRDFAPAEKKSALALIDRTKILLVNADAGKDSSKHDLPPAPVTGNEPEGTTCVGGVVLRGMKGRITCDNRLDARLDITMEGVLPEIRAMIFGKRDDPVKPALPADLTLPEEKEEKKHE